MYKQTHYPGECTIQSSLNGLTEEFEADDIFHIINGNLNVSADKFIENKYSMSWQDYDFSESTPVIIPTGTVGPEGQTVFPLNTLYGFRGPDSHSADHYVERIK